MKVVLSEEKAKAKNYSIEKGYQALDDFFNRCGIEKVSQGMYRCSDFGDMALAHMNMPDCKWFMEIVEEWKANYINDDLDYWEDCLESYYRISK